MQWTWIRRTIEQQGFIQACQRWNINLNALSSDLAPKKPSDRNVQISTAIHRLVLQSGKCLPAKRTNCLPRALAAAFWMQRFDIPFQIRIGIRTENGKTVSSAHAWIEVNGTPVGESPDSISQLKPLDPYQQEV